MLLRGENKEYVVEFKNVEDAYMYFDEFNRAIKKASELKGRLKTQLCLLIVSSSKRKSGNDSGSV